MKEYPVTEGELYGLASLGGAATICFSVGAGLFGYSSTVTKDIAFSSNVAPTIITYYKTMSEVAFYGSFGLFALGGILLILGGIRVRQIITETTHE